MSIGLTRHLIEQFSEQEYKLFLARMQQYANDHGFAIVDRMDDQETVWLGCELSLDAWVVGYIMALGFDQDGNRHKS